MVASLGFPVPASLHLPTSRPLPLADVQGSVDYLTRAYGIDTSEALRRLELQRTHGQLLDLLESQNTYVDSWIDQDHGGFLVIVSTDPSALAAALPDVPDRAHIRVVDAGSEQAHPSTVAVPVQRWDPKASNLAGA